jgi:hypothetical protein
MVSTFSEVDTGKMEKSIITVCFVPDTGTLNVLAGIGDKRDWWQF